MKEIIFPINFMIRAGLALLLSTTLSALSAEQGTTPSPASDPSSIKLEKWLGAEIDQFVAVDAKAPPSPGLVL